MNRRTFLAGSALAGGVALSGCLETPELESANPDVPAAESSDRPKSDVQRRVSLAAADEVPDEYELRIEAELLEGTIADDRTATVRITATNDGPPRALSVGAGDCHLLNRSRGRSDDPEGLWLYRTGPRDARDRAGTRWVEDRPSDRPRGFSNQGCPPRGYESGESLAVEYELWDDYRVDGYLRPGTYRWEESVSLYDDPEATFGDRADASLEWGFSVEVARP